VRSASSIDSERVPISYFIATLIASPSAARALQWSRSGWPYPTSGKRGAGEPEIGMVVAASARVRDRRGTVYPHPGGAHDMAAAFRVGQAPDLGGAERAKQPFLNLARAAFIAPIPLAARSRARP